MIEPLYETYAELVVARPEPVIKIEPIPEFRLITECLFDRAHGIIAFQDFQVELHSGRRRSWGYAYIDVGRDY